MDRRKHAPTRFCWCILVLVLATGGNKAFGQDLFDYVPNLPYTAQVMKSYVVSSADGRGVRRETRLVRMRDSQGTTRIEAFPPDDPGSNHVSDKPVMVYLYVPLRRQYIEFLVSRKMARVMTFPGTGPIPTHGPNLNAIETTTEDLPGQMVNGIYAVGTRTTVRIPSDDRKGPDIVDVEESWVSPDLKIVVLFKHKSTDRGSDDTMWEVQQLDRSEPDAALFEIPKDYKIVARFEGSRADSSPDASDKNQPAGRR